MKVFKVLLIVCLISVFSCSSDDEPDRTPILQEINGTIDLVALSALTGTDATALVTFEGVPAADHLVEAIIGDDIIYKVSTSDPNTFVVFSDFTYFSGSEELWGDGLQQFFGNSSGSASSWVEGFTVLQGAVTDDEVKFNIGFQLEVNGVVQIGDYFIDPKLKIRDRR